MRLSNTFGSGSKPCAAATADCLLVITPDFTCRSQTVKCTNLHERAEFAEQAVRVRLPTDLKSQVQNGRFKLDEGNS